MSTFRTASIYLTPSLRGRVRVVAEESANSRLPVRMILTTIAILALVVLLFRFLPLAEWMQEFQIWVRGLGPLGYVVYALAYAACVVFFVPASILTLGAGALYGLVGGVGVVLVGANLGAILSFLLARTFLRERIEKMTAGNPRFKALDRAIAKDGAKIVLLVRLAPIFPFTYSNYAFGLTGVRSAPYMLASLVGMLPGTIGYVYVGTAAAHAATGTSPASTALNVLGAAATMAVTIFVARLATRAIREAGVEA